MEHGFALCPHCAVRCAGVLIGCWACAGSAAAPPYAGLAQAFKTCVSLYKQPMAADLMRAIFDPSVRASFPTSYRDLVQGLAIQRQAHFATATARLKPGFAVAGVPVQGIYASTCETECPLALWGLEFGGVDEQQKSALQQWVGDAPTTPSSHTDIKVQLSSGPQGEAFLVCDVSD